MYDYYLADHIQKICPHFEILDSIFGEKACFSVPFLFDTLNEDETAPTQNQNESVIPNESQNESIVGSNEYVRRSEETNGTINLSEFFPETNERNEQMEDVVELVANGTAIVLSNNNERMEELDGPVENVVVTVLNNSNERAEDFDGSVDNTLSNRYVYEDPFVDDFPIRTSSPANLNSSQDTDVQFRSSSPTPGTRPVSKKKNSKKRKRTPHCNESNDDEEECATQKISRFRGPLDAVPASRNGFKERVDKEASTAASLIAKALNKRADAFIQKNENDLDYKWAELKLQQEKFEFEKKLRVRELELKKTEIESNEKIKILTLQKEERLAELRIRLEYEQRKSD